MSGCVLRAGGERFDVDAFLATSALRTCQTFRKGDPGFPASHGPVKSSGFNVVVSDVDDDIAAQVEDALAFLTEHGSEIQRLVETGGVEEVVLDFATAIRDVAVQCESFTATLIRAAGALGVGLEVSIYLPILPWWPPES